MYSAEPLPHFVDEYLSYLYEVHPTNATFDGVHLHDDLLEDLSRRALDEQVRTLGGFARRLAAIDPARLTDSERLERPALESSIRARLFDLEEIRTWERSPQYYADILATSLAGQALFDYAPLAERARRVLSKLRQVPRFIQAARDNIKEPPGIFVKVGLESMRGTLRFINEDLPRAFGDLGDLHLLGELADAATEASSAAGAYITYLEEDLAPRSKGSFRLGREKFEQKFQLDEGIRLGPERLLAVAMRELHATQEEFRRVASRMNGSDPLAVWSKAKENHPPPGQLIAVAQQQLEELEQFIERQRIITIPEGAPVAVAPTPRFYRWTFASMWTPGPFEARPLRAFYYITDVDPAWGAERQEEHLRDFNYGALWAISIHEVFPGHFLHYQHLRRLNSKLRKSILFSSAALVEGWAHYCEQMMIEEGFRRSDPTVRLGQLAEALIRLCRLIVGIRLHTEDLSVEQGVRFFKEEAFLEDAGARRCAILASGVPRRSARERNRSYLAASRVDAGRAERRYDRVTMPLYEYQCEVCGHRFERIQKFSDPLVDTCPSCGGAVRKLLSSPAIQFKGSGWYITDYAKKSATDSGKPAADKSDSTSKSAEASSPGDSSKPPTKADS